MDSISQFVLGAAVGEAVLGKKIGNKALLYGGIAGTIPDLDIIAGPLMTEVDALAFHRGISHSIFFAVVGGLLMGWLFYKFFKRFGSKSGDHQLVGLRSWQCMFFLGFITHSILDCFTMYGTQLFAPFTNFRVAFSTVSVADPMYTLPFFICLCIVAFQKRHSLKRLRWNYIGIAWSCLYLCFTVFNKAYVNSVFEQQLVKQNIDYNRFIVGPTIFNNVLWNATVETDSVYYQGQYSLFDINDIQFNPIEKNHNYIDDSSVDRTIEILKWFTSEYYNIIERKDRKLQFNDLRYGTFKGKGDGENDYIFRFVLDKREDGYFVEVAKGGPEEGDEKQMISQLWHRIKGN